MNHAKTLLFAFLALIAIAMLLMPGEASADSNNDDQKVGVEFYLEGDGSGGSGFLDFEAPDDADREDVEVTLNLQGDSGNWIQMGTWETNPLYNSVNLADSPLNMVIFADAPSGTEPATDVWFRATINGNDYDTADSVNLNNDNVISIGITGTLSGTIAAGNALSIDISVRTDEQWSPLEDDSRTIRIHYDSTEAEYGGAAMYDTNINTTMQMMNTIVEFGEQDVDESQYRFIARHTINPNHIATSTFQYTITGAYEEGLPWRNASNAYLDRGEWVMVTENGTMHTDVVWMHGKQSGGVYPGTYNTYFTINDTFEHLWEREADFQIYDSPAQPDLKTIDIRIQRMDEDGDLFDVEDVALYDDLYLKATFSVSADKAQDYQTSYLFYVDGEPYPNDEPDFLQLNGSKTVVRYQEWVPMKMGSVNVSVVIDPPYEDHPNGDIDEGKRQESNNWKQVEPDGPGSTVIVLDEKRPIARIKSPKIPTEGGVAYVNITSDDMRIRLDGSTSDDPDDPENLTFKFSVWQVYPERTDEELAPTQNTGIGYFELDSLPTQNEEWVAKLMVEDGSGRNNWTTVRFTINVPPEGGIIGPEDGDVFLVGEEIEFDADFGDVNNNPLDYKWRSSLKSGYISTSPSFEIDDLPAGRHKITLVVDDGKGGIAQQVIYIYVNTPPLVEIYRPDLDEILVFKTGEPIQFDAGDSYDPDGDALRFEWRKGSTLISSEADFKYNFSASGEFEMTLRVWDLDGAENPITPDSPVEIKFDIVITSPPVALLRNKDKIEVEQGDSITFNAGDSYDDDGDAISFLWDLDGNGDFEVESESPTINQKFDEKGEFLVRLMVVDQYGAESDLAIVTVKVVDKDEDDETDWVLIGGIGGAAVVGLGIVLFLFMGRSKKEDEGGDEPPCPTCGAELEYVDEYESYYCYDCEDYKTP